MGTTFIILFYISIWWIAPVVVCYAIGSRKGRAAESVILALFMSWFAVVFVMALKAIQS